MTNNEQEAGGWDQSDKVSNVLDNMTGVERNPYFASWKWPQEYVEFSLLRPE